MKVLNTIEKTHETAKSKLSRDKPRLTWKNIFMLPSVGVWNSAVIILSYFGICGHLFLSVNGKCTTELKHDNLSSIIYIYDILYFVDVILSIGCKYIRNLAVPELSPANRPLWILIIEVVSLIPFEILVGQATEQETKLHCLLFVNRCLRIVRILYFFYQNGKMVGSKLYSRIIEMFSSMLFLTMIVYSLYCNILCYNEVCEKGHKCVGLDALDMISSKMTTSSSADYPTTLTWFLCCLIAKLICFYSITTIAMSHVTLVLINLYLHQVNYVNQYNILTLRQEKMNLPQYIRKNTLNLYNNIWEYRGGYFNFKNIGQNLPACLLNELMVDISWHAFRHSKLFKDSSLPFLQYISVLMKREFLLPGDYLYSRNKLKDSMVYIVNGTVQLLSGEDEESPVLSLSGGTCLGETSLIISYKSHSNVRCKTYCEFHILKKKMFLRAMTKYPEDCRKITGMIRARYKQGIHVNKISNKTKSKLHGIRRNIDTYTLLWIKNTLHRLMARDEESTYRHEFQNIYLINEINEADFKKLLFTAQYLDLFVITERIELDTNTIFVRSHFPCILQPNSIIVFIWEAIIVIFTIFISFLIPYVSFINERAPRWYDSAVFITTFIFWCDLYVQLSTGVRTRQGVSTKYKTIVTTRMQTFGFWADIASCIPSEMITSIILTDNNDRYKARIHTNRILKLWRVERLFRLWEKTFNANVVLIRYVKFSWINLYTTFVFCCQLYKDYPNQMSSLVFAATQIVTGVGLHDDKQLSSAMLTFMDLVSSFINLLMYAHIGSAYILINSNMFKAQLLTYGMINIIKSRNLASTFCRRVKDFINTQWWENRAARLWYTKTNLCNLTKTLYSEIVEFSTENLMKTHPFFQGFSEDVIFELCSLISLNVYPPEEIIIYTGDVISTVMIVYSGTCELFDSEGKSEKLFNDVMALNLLEAFFEIPASKTCVTRTHCRVFLFPYQGFMKILTKYPEELKELKTFMLQCSDIKEGIMNLLKPETEEVQLSPFLPTTNRSIVNFGYNFRPDSYEEYDYYIPFDRLYPFSFVRYFLMRFTISSNAKFIYFWESMRCVFAFLTAIGYFTLPFVYSEYRFVLTILDLTAFVDIYIRFHICYYNKDGIRVSHPLKTAIYYFKGAFILDLLAVFPLALFVSSTTSSTYMYFMLHVNRLLQMHRYFSFFSYLHMNSSTPLSKLYGMKYIPIMMVLANFLGCVLIQSECSFEQSPSSVDTANYTKGITCGSTSIMSVSNFAKPITPMRAHLYGVYMAASILSTTGIQGFTASTDYSKYIMTVMSIVGLYVTIIIAGKIMVLYSYRHVTLLNYQEAIHSLKFFMKAVGVNTTLKKTIIDSYELKWSRLRGKHIHQLLEPFNVTMQTDFLNAIYGTELYKTSVFTKRTRSFYRNILRYMTHDIILKGGYLETINDISEQMFMLYKGTADVLAADGTKLATLLSGSIFGNLENVHRSRLQISVVASCHAEILSVEALRFHKVLKHYPEIKREFRLLKAKYVSYIPRMRDDPELPSESKIQRKLLFLSHIFNPDSKAMQCWNVLNLLFSCYLGILFDLYKLGSGESSHFTLLGQYTCDVLYIIQFFVRYRTAYVDEDGNLVTESKKIRKNLHANKFLLLITILSLIPFDAIALLFSRKIVMETTLFGLFRLNRLLRLRYIFDYFASTSKKLNINVYITRFGYILLWSTLALCGTSCSMSFLACSISGDNVHPHIDDCQKMSAIKKFEMYTSYFYVAANCLTTTSLRDFYPQGLWLIILYIVVLLILQNLFCNIYSQVFAVLYECNNMKFKFQRNVDRLLYFMHLEDVSDSLFTRIVCYLQLLWMKQKGASFPELLAEAPIYLSDAILNDSFSHLVIDHPVFVKCHSDCLRQIVHKFRNRTYFVDTYIQFKGVIDDSMYFIFEGEVVVLRDEYLYNDDVVATLRGGDSFGVLQGLYRKTPHVFSYRATKATILLMLDLNTWEYLLDFFPASKENIYNAAREYNGL